MLNLSTLRYFKNAGYYYCAELKKKKKSVSDSCTSSSDDINSGTFEDPHLRSVSSAPWQLQFSSRQSGSRSLVCGILVGDLRERLEGDLAMWGDSGGLSLCNIAMLWKTSFASATNRSFSVWEGTQQGSTKRH